MWLPELLGDHYKMGTGNKSGGQPGQRRLLALALACMNDEKKNMWIVLSAEFKFRTSARRSDGIIQKTRSRGLTVRLRLFGISGRAKAAQRPERWPGSAWPI